MGELSHLGILADEECIFPPSLLLLREKQQHKFVTLDQEATWPPKDKHERLHPIVLEQDGVFCQRSHRMVWREANRHKQEGDFGSFCSW